MRKKTLIIDNYDSFTYILKQYFGESGGEPEVTFNDRITISQIQEIQPTHIVLSPGPGTVEEPSDIGVMPEVIRKFHKTIPILGVCLGHQMIGKFFGGEIIRAPKIMHGKRSLIQHNGDGLFEGVKSPFSAMRYHSLIIDRGSIEHAPLRPTAWTDDGILMGMKHENFPIFGVQFHPESLGTPDGKTIIRNFLNA